MFRSIIFSTQLQNCLARGYERYSEASSLVLSCRTVLQEGMKDVLKHHLCYISCRTVLQEGMKDIPKHHLWYSAAELSCKRV